MWKKELLADLSAVRQRSALFYHNYRASRHHSQLQGRSPGECHRIPAGRTIPPGFRLPERLPLTTGQVHFMRAVDEKRQVKVLNMLWDVPQAHPRQGVWVTLQLTPAGATLSVFDAAPDAPKRTCLAQHPFPLKEEVVPLAQEFQPKPQLPRWVDLLASTLGYLKYCPSTMS